MVNRRPPINKRGADIIPIGYDSRAFDANGDYLCTTGLYTRVWDSRTGEQIAGFMHGEATRAVSVSFKAECDPKKDGQRLWVGNIVGDLMELDIASGNIIATKGAAHNRHEVVKIYRYANEMWTLDESGTLHIWISDSGPPELTSPARSERVPKGHTFSLVVDDKLWYATSKSLYVFSPGLRRKGNFQVLSKPLSQAGAGDIVSGCVLLSEPDHVYFGHSDGKVTVYSKSTYEFLGMHTPSLYKINTMAGVGSYLWAGFSTGIIYVYDTSQSPWVIKKEWRAHKNPVLQIQVDRSSMWQFDRLQVVSLGTENCLSVWDGLLEDDWHENEMKKRDAAYSTLETIKGTVMTWNAGASTPQGLRCNSKDASFIPSLLSSSGNPDILVFGFQELVDLEDKKTTAISFFKSKKKDGTDQERIAHQYRAWRDYLVQCIDDQKSNRQSYHLLQSSTLVGLFTCIFVKSHLVGRITNLSAKEVKRGMGGLHGNKVSIISTKGLISR
jgi:hypothetical protein